MHPLLPSIFLVVLASVCFLPSKCLQIISTPIQDSCVISEFESKPVPNGGRYMDATSTSRPIQMAYTRRRRTRREVTEEASTSHESTSAGDEDDRPVSRNIIAGEPADSSAWPYLVAVLHTGDTIRFENEYWDLGCGGTLIGKRFVLTAAHCFVRRGRLGSWSYRDASEYAVRIGDYSLLANNVSTAVLARVTRFIPHPRFNFADVKRGHDIAVIQLDRDIAYNDRTQPACLPAPDAAIPPANQPCQAAGWGAITRDGSRISAYPRETTLWVSSDNDCYGPLLVPEDAQDKRLFCAGDPAARADTCAGDSGGPLMCQRTSDNIWMLAGVVSFGRAGCGIQRVPGVYTTISKYTTWINSTMRVMAAMGTTVSARRKQQQTASTGASRSSSGGEQFDNMLLRILLALGNNGSDDSNGRPTTGGRVTVSRANNQPWSDVDHDELP